ncbi:tRNA lysidine(34) synthetase TilS [Kosmotoga pacifica]|uniref:tRNA lysidine(34) synthetase TilS n=1 Tax=Kosmotoga pacifica TaxID=1330330 RepID=UPI00069C9E6B|nr:tRNA lysidine(34) synthetase TilS [Kosmotoga pacifica]
MTSSFERKVLEFIKQYEMIEPKSKILIAVSGGKDSMALLHFLSKHTDLFDCEIVAANLDHGLRGAEGKVEAQMIRKYCSERGIPFYHERIDVRKFMEENREFSPEEAARLKRMEFLHRIRASVGADKIAVAHHLNDLAETILMRLVRGTGIKGILGMKPIDGMIIRPFLSVTVQDIKDYVTINMIPFSSDKTNTVEDFDRNYIRLKVMPLLKKLNPAYEKAFWRFFVNTFETFMILEKNVRKLLSDTHWREGQALIKKELLMTCDWPVTAEYVRIIVQRLSARHYPPSRERVMVFKKMLASPKGGWKIQFPGGVDCVHEGSYIRFYNSSSIVEPEVLQISNIPFMAEFDFGNVIIEKAHDIPDNVDGSYMAVCPVSTVKFPLFLRGAKKTDKIIPFGLHSKKDVVTLAAHKATPDVFLNLMVLEDSEGRVLWIPGVRASEFCRSIDRKDEFLLFRFERRSTSGT